MDSILKRCAIRSALRKPTPQRFSLERENWPNINFFSVVLKSEAEKPRDVLVLDMTRSSISGLRWNGQRYEEEVELKISELQNMTLEITHHFRQLRTRYDSAADYFWGKFTFLRYRVLLKEWWSQKRFNSRLRFRTDRIEVLKELVEVYLRGVEGDPLNFLGDGGISAWDLFQRIHGQRALDHPAFSSAFARFELILKSLVDSNDLSMDGDLRYQVKPQSLRTIAEFELEQQRHNDHVKHNRRLVWLTAVIACAAIVALIKPS